MRLFVRDNGPGIAPDKLNYIFEEFTQLETSAPPGTVGSGTGLGLAIVARIIATHRGRLTLTPLAGGGLRVDVGLPTAHQPVQGRSIADRGTDAQLPVAIPRPGSDDQPDQLAE